LDFIIEEVKSVPLIINQGLNKMEKIIYTFALVFLLEGSFTSEIMGAEDEFDQRG
jgi:hypothetical protein